MRLLAVLLGLAAVFAEDIDEKDVLVLTKDNFQSAILTNPLILVEFYAPWCGHCKHLAPEYAQAATALLKNDPPIALAKVDATVESELATKYGITGYPTLLVFRGGKESKYNGPRTADGIVAYMKKQVGPAAKEVTTKEQIEALATSDAARYVVVGIFDAATHQKSQLYSAFYMISNSLRDEYLFAKVVDPTLAAALGVPTGEALVAFQYFPGGPLETVTYPATSTKGSDVESWVRLNSVPVFGECNERVLPFYQARGVPLVTYYSNVNSEPQHAKQLKYVSNRIKPIAEKYRNEVSICYMDKKYPGAVQQLERAGITVGEFGFVLEKGSDTYVYDGKFDRAALDQFVADALAGTHPKYIRSELEPATQEGVHVVVGKTFDAFVSDPTKHKLLEFYAPWCGHCKSLAPKYDELAKKVANLDSVVVAKIDATANYFDQKRFDVGGYPTLYWIPAGENAKVEKYDGPREVKGMQSFIKKKVKAHAKNEL